METIQIIYEKPKFELGEKVYWVCGVDDVIETEITAFRAFVFNSKEGMMAVAKSARLLRLAHSDYFEDVNWDDVPLKYLTTNKDRATEWAVFHPVKCSKKDWLKAIGRRETYKEIKKHTKELMKRLKAGKKTKEIEDPLEVCELQRCCAHISDIRDVLLICQEKKGLIGWDREYLKLLIEEAPHDMENLIGPILSKVLKQLNIKFEWMN